MTTYPEKPYIFPRVYYSYFLFFPLCIKHPVPFLFCQNSNCKVLSYLFFFRSTVLPSLPDSLASVHLSPLLISPVNISSCLCPLYPLRFSSVGLPPPPRPPLVNLLNIKSFTLILPHSPPSLSLFIPPRPHFPCHNHPLSSLPSLSSFSSTSTSSFPEFSVFPLSLLHFSLASSDNRTPRPRRFYQFVIMLIKRGFTWL